MYIRHLLNFVIKENYNGFGKVCYLVAILLYRTFFHVGSNSQQQKYFFFKQKKKLYKNSVMKVRQHHYHNLECNMNKEQ